MSEPHKLARYAPTSAAMISTLSGNAIKLFAAMYLHASNWTSRAPTIEAGYDLLHTYSTLAKDTIQRCVTELEMAGYLKITHENAHKRRIYVLMVDVELSEDVPETPQPDNLSIPETRMDRPRNQDATVPETRMTSSQKLGHVSKKSFQRNNSEKRERETARACPEIGTTEQQAAFETPAHKISTQEAADYALGRSRIEKIVAALKAAHPGSVVLAPPVTILDDMACKVKYEDESWFEGDMLRRIAVWCLDEQDFAGYRDAALDVEKFIRNFRGIASKYQVAHPRARAPQANPQKPRIDSSTLELQWAREIRSGERTWAEIVSIYGEAATREVCERTGFDPLAVKRVSAAGSGRGNLGDAEAILAAAGIRKPQSTGSASAR